MGSKSEKVVDDFPERNEVGLHNETLEPLEDIQKSRWERSWPTIACGAGLFSDGYLNGYAPTHSHAEGRPLTYHKLVSLVRSTLY